MKLLFLNLSALKFDVTTPAREPLGGSESALCYLAQQLAADGFEVTLAARLPEGAPEIVAGVSHVDIGVLRDRAFFETGMFDTFVTVNAAMACPRLKEYDPAAFNVYWDHLPPDQEAVKPLGNALVREKIDTVIYVSPWQKAETEKQFAMTAPSRVIANGLTPAFENMFASADELLAVKQPRAAYTSVPDRGLAELLDALPAGLALDAFSSMRVYQSDDGRHADVLARAAQKPGVALHGSVSQTELAARLKSAAFFAYPCITPETFCLAALEALAAGMKVIATDVGGISTTTMGLADLLPVNTGDSRAQFIEKYRAMLAANQTAFGADPQGWARRQFEQVQAVNRACNWKVRAKEWADLIRPRKRS